MLLSNRLFYAGLICDEKVITNDLDIGSNSLSDLFPSHSVVLVEGVFNGYDWEFLCVAYIQVTQLVGS